MTTHDLKTWPQFFSAVMEERKTFEIRRSHDRTFAVGDALRLREWDPATEEYTGRVALCVVVYVVTGAPFLPDNLTVMGIACRPTEIDQLKARLGVLERAVLMADAVTHDDDQRDLCMFCGEEWREDGHGLACPRRMAEVIRRERSREVE